MTLPDVVPLHKPDTTRREHFAQLPFGLLMDTNVSSGAKVLFGILWVRAIYTQQVIRTPVKVLCRELGMPRRTLTRHLSELRESGYVERVGEAIRLNNAVRDLRSDVARMWNDECAKNGSHHEPKLAPIPYIHEEDFEETAGHEMTEDIFAEAKRLAEAQRKKTDKLAQEKKSKRVASARRSRSTREVARDAELDSLDPLDWMPKHLAAYYVRRYRDQYPEYATAPTDHIMSKAAHGKLVTLRETFTDHKLMDEDKLGRAIDACKQYIDHAFDNHDRLRDSLRISGSFSVGVLLGFRDSILSDMKGTTTLGGTSSRIGEHHDRGESGWEGVRSTSDKL